MPYKFLEDVALADVAFEATGKTLDEMFESSALAVTRTMVKDLDSIKIKVKKKISVSSENIEMLLFNFLQEIVFYKDSDKLLFSKFSLKVDEKKLKVTCVAEGEELNMKKHELLVDVKAITLHRFEVEKTARGWRSQVILDI
jgi:SHS2 domain-containing protein